ncbi:MAG: rhodanese-like domain-containing protein [Planctomycetota bacterium]|nr:MAG: rhodanese-like domain-containing protein [Planctomycetota bacterium]
MLPVPGPTMSSTLTEAGLFCAAALAAGLAWNWLSPEGIRLEEDYRVAAPAAAGQPPAQTVAELIRELGYQTMSFEEVKDYAAVAQDPHNGILLLDARKAESFRQGHIPGAVMLDPYHLDDLLSEEMRQTIAEAVVVIIYCTGGDCEDSLLLAQRLVPAVVGVESVFLYVGGINEWREQGQALEKD